ncbi:MAG: polyprenol monophosphomannose synthase [Acidimicrobiia bacterium]|nr:polyprenol monophosphomannose synthase [Acidimicrobiia bacterium]
MPRSTRPLVVIPTYQEAENIVTVLEQVRAVAPELSVLVVDDGSPDGTADLAESAGVALGQISVLRRTHKSGLGGAYRAGFEWGIEMGYDVLVEMDADLSHNPADVPRLLDAVDNGASLAVGSRYVSGGGTPHWPLRRRLLSRWGNRYAGMVLGLGVRDATAGFRAYRAELLQAIDYQTTSADGYAFQVEMAYRVRRAGGLITEVPIIFSDRVRGTSKMSSRIVAEAMLLVTWWALRDRVFRRGR